MSGSGELSTSHEVEEMSVKSYSREHTCGSFLKQNCIARCRQLCAWLAYLLS